MIKIIEKDNFYINLWHDYQFSSKKYNWIEYTFITIRWEFSRITRNGEIHIGFLGFHFFLNWVIK